MAKNTNKPARPRASGIDRRILAELQKISATLQAIEQKLGSIETDTRKAATRPSAREGR
jgi:hypothetical protein